VCREGLVDNTVISWIPYIGSLNLKEWCGLWRKEIERLALTQVFKAHLSLITISLCLK